MSGSSNEGRALKDSVVTALAYTAPSVVPDYIYRDRSRFHLAQLLGRARILTLCTTRRCLSAAEL
jgi:hypothetical protein